MPSGRQRAPFQPALVIAPRREKGRAEEQRRETLHYFKPFFSSLLPSLLQFSGIILWLWSLELGVMWVKALSASTQRSKQSLIVGTQRKKKPLLLFMARL